MYAIFENGKQISKFHKHRICALIEAYERGMVVCSRQRDYLAGCEIREVKHE